MAEQAKTPPAATEPGGENEHFDGALNRHFARRRVLPPYGRAVLAARRSGHFGRYVGTLANGRNPTLWIMVGTDAWDVAHRCSDRLAIVAPDHEDPAAFDWYCLAGAEPVLLIHCGDVDGRRQESDSRKEVS